MYDGPMGLLGLDPGPGSMVKTRVRVLTTRVLESLKMANFANSRLNCWLGLKVAPNLTMHSDFLLKKATFCFYINFYHFEFRTFFRQKSLKFCQKCPKMPFLEGFWLPTCLIEKWRQIWPSTTVFCIKILLFAFMNFFETSSSRPFS